jgi:hypothetical protein
MRLLAAPALAALLLATHVLADSSSPRTLAYDARSFLLNGERQLLLSGSIHYQRVLVADWPRVLALTAELGLTTVQTYVAADEHQPERDVPWSFAGQNNISAFVALAATFNLSVVVRIGPYICGEHFNGGVPLWMRSTEGSGAHCFRCSDPAWEAFSDAAVATVVGELEANGLLWPQGGPVIALQVENEYTGPDLPYLEHVVAAARNATTAVPWMLCHDLSLCSQVNAAAKIPGGGGAALCTINGFWEDGSGEGVQQPSPAFVQGQQTSNPLQPLMWTEDQGWFDQWGVGQRVRTSSDILYGMARFLSYGGSYHNFYMLTGGSNFGYSAADGVTTAYAPDTAIDSLLLRHEPKFSVFKAFFAGLRSVAATLLAHPAATPTPLGKHCESAVYGGVTFVSNLGTTGNETELVVVNGASFLVPNHTVIIIDGTTVVANTSSGAVAAGSHAPGAGPGSPSIPSSSSSSGPLQWTTLVETVGAGNRTASAAAGSAPLEQLGLTRNRVDYAFYTLTVNASVVANATTLEVSTCGGEYVYLFAAQGQAGAGAGAGAGAAIKAAALAVDAGRTSHTFALPPTSTGGSSSSTTTLSVLVSAMGLSTSPTPTSCKGVRTVRAGGGGKVDLTTLGWSTQWVFAGEAAQVYTPAGAAAADWQPVGPDGGATILSWFKSHVDLPPTPPPAAAAAAAAAAPPPQLAYALDLLGATKGVAWVNGVNIGRYNLEAGQCNGPCAPPIHAGTCYIFWANCGKPTQRFYHVPASILQPTGNLVVLFEETNTVPQAGQGPVAPSPPPRPRGEDGLAAPPAPGLPRDLTTVALVALVQHTTA